MLVVVLLLLAGTAHAQTTKHVWVTPGSIGGDTLSCKSALVSVSLIVPDSGFVPYDTSTGWPMSLVSKVYTVDSTYGTITMDLIPNNYIRPDTSRYQFDCSINGKPLWSVRVRITADGELMTLDRAD